MSVNFRQFYRINDYVAVTTSFIGNTLLLVLIITRTSKAMSSFKKILIQSCLTDLLLTLAVAVTEPIVVFKHGHEAMINNGIFHKISTNLDMILIMFWASALVFSYCSISVPFLYRYFSVVRNKNLSGISYMCLFILPLTLNSIHMLIGGCLFYPSQEKLEIVKRELGEYFLEDEMDHISAGMIGLSTRFDTWYVAIDMFVFTAGSYLIAIWCNFKIWKFLKEHMPHASPSIKEMNSQLNKALIAQAIGPLIVNVAPMLTMVYCIVSKTENVELSLWTGLPLAWIPVVNPILTIWLIKPYRNALLGKKETRVEVEDRINAISFT